MTGERQPSEPASGRIAGHAVAVRHLGSGAGLEGAGQAGAGQGSAGQGSAGLGGAGQAGARQGLALHCSLAHGGAWAPLAAALPGLRLIAPDLPGHGGSAGPGGRDLHRLSTDIAAELAQAAGPVDVIGHSFGATVALRLALERPELVRSLTLVEPVLFAAARGRAEFAESARHQQAVAELCATDPEAAAALFHAAWGGGIPFAALPERQRRAMAARMYLVTGAGPVLEGDAPALLAPGRLEALAMPVLLAEGTASPPVIAVIQDALAQRIGTARRLRVAGAGHMLPITHPAPLAAAIGELLAAGGS